ncbi:MAG: hypothetical protein K8T26_17065 [Lentisphaerae bacterium]|nr:hypothetical protein [Lentisphaerota bacterium]
MENGTIGKAQDVQEKWVLRTGPETIYGELALGVLAQWAEQGRITPDSEVSRNGRDWVRAETVADLKMDWFVSLKSGMNYGPVNLLAVPGLFRRGIIDRTAVLEHKITHRKIPAIELLKGLKKPGGAAPTPVPASPETGPAVVGGTGAGAVERGTADERDTPTADAVPRELVPAADISRHLHIAKERIAELSMRLAALQSERNRAESETKTTAQIQERALEDARRLVAQAQRERDEAVTEQRQVELKLTRQVNDLESLLRDRQRATESTELTRRDMAQKAEALDVRVREFEALAARSEALLAEAREGLRAEREQSAELRLRLQTQEFEYKHHEAHWQEQMQALAGQASPEKVKELESRSADLAHELEVSRHAADEERSRVVAAFKAEADGRNAALAGKIKALEATVVRGAAEHRHLAEEMETQRGQLLAAQEEVRRAQDAEKAVAAELAEARQSAEALLAQAVTGWQRRVEQAEAEVARLATAHAQSVAALKHDAGQREAALVARAKILQDAADREAAAVAKAANLEAVAARAAADWQRANQDAMAFKAQVNGAQEAAGRAEAIRKAIEGELAAARAEVEAERAKVTADWTQRLAAEQASHAQAVASLKDEAAKREASAAARIASLEEAAARAAADAQRAAEASAALRGQVVGAEASAKRTVEARNALESELAAARAQVEAERAKVTADWTQRLAAEQAAHAQAVASLKDETAKREASAAARIVSLEEEAAHAVADVQCAGEQSAALKSVLAEAQMAAQRAERVQRESESELAAARQRDAEHAKVMAELQGRLVTAEAAQARSVGALKQEATAREAEAAAALARAREETVEVQKACKSLESRVKEAERVAAGRESELAEVRLTLAVAKVGAERAAALEAQLGQQTATGATLAAERATWAAAMEALKRDLAAAVETVAKDKRALEAAAKREAVLKQDGLRHREELDRLEKEVERLHAAQKESTKRGAEQERHLTSMRKEVAGLKAELAEAAQQVQVMSAADLNLQGQSAAWDVERRKLEERLASTTKDMEQRLSTVVAARADADRQAKRLAEAQAQDARRLDELQRSSREQAERLASVRNALQSARQDAEARLGVLTGVAPIEWYVMLDGGNIFGPVSLDMLYEWAAECRLGPGHSISRDRKTWEPVERVAGLGLEWMVTLADDSAYGPVNVFAVRHLMADGVLAAGKPITHCRDGRKGTWEEIVAMEVRRIRAEAAMPSAQADQARAGLGKLTEQVRQLESLCGA